MRDVIKTGNTSLGERGPIVLVLVGSLFLLHLSRLLTTVDFNLRQADDVTLPRFFSFLPVSGSNTPRNAFC